MVENMVYNSILKNPKIRTCRNQFLKKKRGRSFTVNNDPV